MAIKKAARMKKLPKRLQRMAKNKKKTTTKKVQNRAGKYFLVRLQGKVMKKENDDPATRSNDSNVGLDVIEHSKANNIVDVRPVMLEISRTFKELPAAIKQQTACMSEQVVKADVADVGKSEPKCKTPNKEEPNDVEATVLLRDDERVCEDAGPNDDELTLQAQKGQEFDMESHIEDDINDPRTLDEPPALLPHSDDDGSMAELKNIELMKDEENTRSESTEKLGDAFTETTEEIKCKLNELSTSIKKFNDQSNVMLKMLKKFFKNMEKLPADFCCNSCKSLEENLTEYQKIIYDPRHFRIPKYCATVNAIRSYGYISVIPWCMVEEIRRLISLNQADIDSDHPILIRLARDGFFSDSSGLVSCFFCGRIIHNYLFLSHHHDRLINLLDNHFSHCDRRHNIAVESYGSHVNLAALMGGMNQQLHRTVPSGCQYRENGRRGFCQQARWILDNNGSIVPSGMRLLQGPQGSRSLPQPDLCLVTPTIPPQNNVQALPNTRLNAVPSSISASAVSSSVSEALSVSPLNNVLSPSQLNNIAERESQQQIEEVVVEQNPDETVEVLPDQTSVPGDAVNTEETVRAELASNIDNGVNADDVQVEGNNHIDIERQLPVLHIGADDNTSTGIIKVGHFILNFVN